MPPYEDELKLEELYNKIEMVILCNFSLIQQLVEIIHFDDRKNDVVNTYICC